MTTTTHVEPAPRYQTYGNRKVKAWVDGVLFEPEAQQQVFALASMPWIFSHVAVMPDVHAGKGSTVGTVFATTDVVVPAAVGVDIGCGMIAQRLNLTQTDLEGKLPELRRQIEHRVPVGGPGLDVGSWPKDRVPRDVEKVWRTMDRGYDQVVRVMEAFAADRGEAKKLRHPGPERQLGTLGTGNHFIELCVDQDDRPDDGGRIWILLHSGSRGPGNKIGDFYTRFAQRLRKGERLPDRDLAWLERGEPQFGGYLEAMTWAQKYAWESRLLMLGAVRAAIVSVGLEPEAEWLVHCHHNYLSQEQHFGELVQVTRKGAVRADEGMYGIIPGSMGARSYIVRGLGNPESFKSCSHGAGRAMSRSKAKREITLDEHRRAMEGIEGRTDAGVIDESPRAYKDINSVLAAESDLCEPVHMLKQLLVVKG